MSAQATCPFWFLFLSFGEIYPVVFVRFKKTSKPYCSFFAKQKYTTIIFAAVAIWRIDFMCHADGGSVH